MFIVYKTTNLTNNKFYLGVHGCTKKCAKACNYIGSGIVLKQAIKKYGRENFIRETLMEFDTSEEAYDYEAWLVNDYMVSRPDCYNMVCGGEGGFAWDFERRQLFSFNQLGEKNKMFGLFGEQNPNYGRVASEETKQKISSSRKGSKLSDSGRERLKNRPIRSGWNHSEETKQKLRKPKSIETKIKISEANSGRISPKRNIPVSEEQKIRQSETMRNKPRVTCPYCNQVGSSSNMKRWHFDNCKYKE